MTFSHRPRLSHRPPQNTADHLANCTDEIGNARIQSQSEVLGIVLAEVCRILCMLCVNSVSCSDRDSSLALQARHDSSTGIQAPERFTRWRLKHES